MTFARDHYKSYILLSLLLLFLIIAGKVEILASIVILFYWTNIKIFTFAENKVLRSVAFIFTTIISYGLISHKIPGFNNILYFDNISLSEFSAPYSSYINFDKPFLALLLIYHYKKRKLYETKFAAAFIYGILLAIVAASILAFMSVYFRFIALDPKIPTILPRWVMMNIITVVAEEALFRGFLQHSLLCGLKKLKLPVSISAAISLAMISILFGLLHFQGGQVYMLISGIAGLFYGYALFKTGTIESSIIVHFVVNLSHILLFTYPSAA